MFQIFISGSRLVSMSILDFPGILLDFPAHVGSVWDSVMGWENVSMSSSNFLDLGSVWDSFGVILGSVWDRLAFKHWMTVSKAWIATQLNKHSADYMNIYTCTCVYIYICIYIHLCIDTYLCIYVQMCTYLYIYV